MDWVHCNSCFGQPEPGLTFSLTNCGHMYCSKCMNVRSGGRNKCKICQKDCKHIQLVPEIKQEVKQYFHEPDQILSELINVLEFQKHHRMRLVAHWMNINKKYTLAKKEIGNLREALEKMLVELKRLDKENRQLKNALSTLTHRDKEPEFRTPLSGRSISSSGSRHRSARKGKLEKFNVLSSRRSYLGPSTLLTPMSMSED